VLLPAIAHHVPPTHDAVVRVLTDHIDIRRRAADLLADPTAAPQAVRGLGERLHAHIRHEERTLFPLVEAALSDDELFDLAVALERAQRQQDRYRASVAS
jgi:hemerythrin-like domain-containing protein